jgi:hypothetical protein
MAATAEPPWVRNVIVYCVWASPTLGFAHPLNTTPSIAMTASKAVIPGKNVFCKTVFILAYPPCLLDNALRLKALMP